jgi:sugar phosphate isomerase/epimerase
MSRSITRRQFTETTAKSALFLTAFPVKAILTQKEEKSMIRLGGPVFTRYENPDEWVNAIKLLGYRAAYCPVDITASQDEIKAYKNAAKKADIIISEVGVWNNPITSDEAERKSAIEKNIKCLQLADEIAANCCVNVSGSRNEKYWAGPHMENLSEETFDMVVETTRKIIDAVNPTHTCYTLEAMPWAFPYSADSYLKLIKVIDRKGFAVHLDPVNMVVSPEIYFNNGKMIGECFAKLGPFIKSCHAKDIIIREDIYLPHLDEVRAGTGKLNYAVFLKELSKLQDVPLMLEHLNTQEEYKSAADYIREVAKNNGIIV